MEFKGLKINIIVLVVGLILILFFVGQHLMNIYNIEKPLKEELTQLDAIESIILAERNGMTDIIVSLKPDTNFYKIYKQIVQISEEKLGDKKGKIIISNEPEHELSQIFNRLHYSIYEGLATSEFVKMKERIDVLAQNNQLEDYKLRIDTDAVYLQLEKNGQSAYYRIPYNNTVAVKVEGGGSSG